MELTKFLGVKCLLVHWEKKLKGHISVKNVDGVTFFSLHII